MKDNIMKDNIMDKLKPQNEVKYTQKPTQIIQEYIENNYKVQWNEIKERIEIDEKPRTRNIVQYITHQMKLNNPSLPVNIQNVENALSFIAIQNAYNPVHEYFNQLPEYDGVDYVQQIVDCIPCDQEQEDVRELLLTWLDNTYRKQFTATPGFMLVLAGQQGKNKGRFVRYLASGVTDKYPEMFTECAVNPDSKDSDMFQAEYFIWEVSEFASSFKKKDVDGIKQAITRDMVTGTKKLSGETRYQLARAGLFGTINPQATGFLIDETGSRRFPVLELSGDAEVNMTKLPNIDNVWSQIKHRYDNGLSTPFMTKELQERVQEHNKSYQVKDELYEILEDNLIPDKDGFISNDAIKILFSKYLNVFYNSKSVKKAMQSMGYSALLKKNAGIVERGYVGCKLRDEDDGVSRPHRYRW